MLGRTNLSTGSKVVAVLVPVHWDRMLLHKHSKPRGSCFPVMLFHSAEIPYDCVCTDEKTAVGAVHVVVIVTNILQLYKEAAFIWHRACE